MTTETIPVNLSDREWELLVGSFIHKSFLPESADTYRIALEDGHTHIEAVLAAIRNEAANDVLLDVIGDAAVAEFAHELDELDLELSLPAELDTMAAWPLPENFFDLDLSGIELPAPEPEPTGKEPLTLIWVTFQKEGIHRYPAAATDPNLATGDEFDVSFLANPHRHIFHFRIGIQVFHDDRDIEFIQFKRWLEGMYADGTLELNHKSCEMLAADLHVAIADRYPGRKMSIDVSEDGENGATILYFE